MGCRHPLASFAEGHGRIWEIGIGHNNEHAIVVAIASNLGSQRHNFDLSERKEEELDVADAFKRATLTEREGQKAGTRDSEQNFGWYEEQKR